MNRPPFTHCPSAWIVTPRTGSSPAEYAASVERFAAPRHMGRTIFGWAIAVLLVVLAAHLYGRI